jgi:8-amino-3,8-dideoxy-alpha-D-manno-octulosonate transaminase
MEQLAIDGGPRAVEALEGRGEPKLGHEEFLALAETWGYSPETVARIREAVAGEDLGRGAFLARYYNPRPSKVDELERVLTEFLGVEHVLAVSSGTAALHTAYVAADIGCGDEVIVPAFTFMATAAAAVAARGMPVWCEVDETLTLDPVDLERQITPRTKVIAPVHMSGYVCDMEPILDVARRHGLRVIEDCAQSFGASYKGRRVGTLGDLGCYSISCYKVTGAGEGGLVVSHDQALFDRAQGWAECGGLWRPDRFAPERWEGELFCGVNYRMSELHGAIDLVQVGKADAQLARWRTNKRRILSQIPVYAELTLQRIPDLDGEMGHSIGCFAPTAEEAERLVRALHAEGVPCGTRGANPPPDWHYAHDIQQILQRRAATSDGCPWTCAETMARGGPVEYAEDLCPRSRDLTSRHVRISVDQWWTEADCAKIAAAITKVGDACYTRDSRADNWLEAVL